MESGIFNTTYQNLVEQFDKELLVDKETEPENVRIKRIEAFDQFRLKGFPSVKNEDWRFTNLNRILKDTFVRIKPSVESISFQSTGPAFNCARLVLHNGKFLPEFSDKLPEGIRFVHGEEALRDPLYSEKLASIASGDSPLLALNTAFFEHFYVIHVQAKTVIEQPVHISHNFSSEDIKPFVPYRLLVIADELSEASITETFESDSEQPFLVSYVNEYELKEAAVLHTCSLNNLNENAFFIRHSEIKQEKNSTYNNVNLSLAEAALIRNDLNCRLQGSQTETNLWGSYILSGQQHVDNHTLVDHISPNCNSNELYKGIMMDRSHAVFNGKVFVRPDAQKTNAFQQNNNILMNDQAVINSKPQLEIFADDVKCSHGSTAGQFDEEAMFYLRTRGIGENLAKKMLIEAFISEVHSKIRIEEVQEYANYLLLKKLEGQTLANTLSL